MNLKELTLTNNNLSKLPNEIGNLVNLIKLDLARNELLILNENQNEWITKLEKKGCIVVIDGKCPKNKIPVIDVDEDETVLMNTKYRM
ncbi:leucine-rich repeat domain-containing protein [bacterium]|nr:leucine-rich repeat domain-containing protein [bacterium]MBU1994104.1 leucine-rich repeat domain-containing protein [bacterium]